MGGVKTEKGCFGRKKKSSWHLKILLGIRRLGNFFPGDMGDYEIKILESLRLWGECLPKIWDNIPDFLEDFYSHMVLPKQHLLGLSPLCIHWTLKTFTSFQIPVNGHPVMFLAISSLQ